MVRRLFVVLCLVFGGLTAATPAIAQKNQAEFNLLRDNIVAAGRPAIDALTASAELMTLLLDAAGQANSETVTPEWVKTWSGNVDRKVAELEAMFPQLRQLTPAEIQRLSLGYAPQIKGLNRINRVRAGLLDSMRQIVFFARECQAQAVKAANGDEAARQRMVRIGISSNRLTMEAQIVTLDGAADDMPDDQPQKPLSLASLSNDRATLEVYRLLERSHTDTPLDAAGTAQRMRGHVAEARRQARLIPPAVNIQLQIMKKPGTPPDLTRKVSALLITYGPSADTELQIANLLEATAGRIEAGVDDPGDDAWGLDLTAPLLEKRINDHAARIRMVQGM
jgi:hypothetical protein